MCQFTSLLTEHFDSYSHLCLVSIFYQLTSEKNQIQTGDLKDCGQTLQLIRFYLIRNMIGIIIGQQFKFPFLNILWSFFLSYGKVKNLFMLGVRISSNGCTREVWRARKIHKSSSRRSRKQLQLFECSPNFPSASITRYTHS